MGKAIEWIRNSIDTCVNFFAYEQAYAQNLFAELEGQYSVFSYIEKQEVIKILKSQFVIEDLIYVLSFFVKYMDRIEFEDMLLDCLDNSDFDCYTSSMMELQLYVDVDEHYEKKRAIHSKNVEKLAEELGVDYPYLIKDKRNKNRIVIITEQILNDKHAPTKSVLDFAVALKKLGYELTIFVCPSDMQLPEGTWHNAICMNSVAEVRNDYFALDYRDITLDLYQINMNEEGINQYKKMMDYIYEYNPLFVYSMGLMNPVGDVVNKFTTLVSKKYTLGLPLSQADVLVEIEGNNERADVEYDCCNNQIIIPENKSVTYFEGSRKVVTREMFGLPKEEFLIAVVGNRLDEELDETFSNLLRRIISVRDDVCVVIIGQITTSKKLFEAAEFVGHIYYIDYCSDLMSLYKVVDLYINPKRYGGGYSALMALVSQVPVITLPNCDVAFNAGEKFVVESYEEMYERAKMCMIDSDYYKKAKSYTFRFEKDYSFDNMINEVKKSLNQIIDAVMSE